ncbi:hypothetical protein BJ138DRAFT_1176241 [Hygrophoropsis aurantiaca]|uniref:Uncharacterized protein n=1 Tax=Hygrophoropsis aurantiaca TaxID=72124 RepID=A0ACB8AQD1_9AGAM|nr:hypothetical protein BJ138DRAFT_1176241 [Hygrophoropsis aurantiaca]
MIPLPAHTVNIVLQYISPPSQLSQPLPPHLVSKALLQRHHYLQIFPSFPQDYLCWPAPHSARAIELLESCNEQADDDRADAYPTRYAFDGEHTYAHVYVASDQEGVRILFQWDVIDGWKYHDLQLMPFPILSYSTIEELAAPGSSTFNKKQTTIMISEIADMGAQSEGEEDDVYWNAYGGALGDNYSPLPPQSAKQSVHEGAEDAYWAQYASVQGSGDSTLPSPLPNNNRKLQPSANPAHDEPIIPISLSTIHARSLTSNLGPPSPGTLTHLLNFISPRKDVYSPSLDEPPSAFTSDTPSPFSTVDDLATPLSADGDQIAHVVSPVAVKLNGISFSDVQRRQTRTTCATDGSMDQALTDSMRGIYQLWKANQQESGDQRASFLRIVQAAIAEA